METRRILILVEGDDDEDFINIVFRPIIEGREFSLKIVKYAQKTIEKTRKIMQSVQAMNGICILMRDLDNEPCLLRRKTKIKKKLCPTWNCCNFVIVVSIIEGWYLAGLPLETCLESKLNWRPCRTETVTKAQFNSIVSSRMTRYEFQQLILENYDFQQGLSHNESLNYFSTKLDSIVH